MKTNQSYPPVRGKQLVSLNLAKRPEGVSQLEALAAGGGIRLAAQIGRLEAKGHRFDREREGLERHTRYWWKGWAQPSAAASPLPSNQPGTYSANL